MIILEGPDGSGKSILAKQLEIEGFSVMKAVAATEYDDYMEALSGEKSEPVPLQALPFTPGPLLDKDTRWVCDRWFWSEMPYSEHLRNTNMKFSLKEFHNLHLTTIAHNPVVLLHTRNSKKADSVPAELFDPILKSYREWFKLLDISYLEWDYLSPPITLEELLTHEEQRRSHAVWWRNLAKRGIAGIGNTANPRVMLIAEELGPSNLYHLPFERGPSGYYLSELFDEGEVPLSSFYLTNWKKVLDNNENRRLLEYELSSSGVESVIILGGEAKKAQPIIEAFGLNRFNIYNLKHPGWVVNHSDSAREMAYRKKGYLAEWKAAWKAALGVKDTTPQEGPMTLVMVS